MAIISRIYFYIDAANNNNETRPMNGNFGKLRMYAYLD